LMLLIANVDSRAGAAEFAGLGVFFMLLLALPVTLIIGAVLLSGESRSPPALFGRGMIAPGVVIGAAIAYQSGLWNWLT
ncbi:MAG: hypothetical protein KJO38_06745, partial [Gammaproteobacteria bacterium]|nr:hypothetical protein [Gammaproteobacteria bacterium]